MAKKSKTSRLQKSPVVEGRLLEDTANDQGEYGIANGTT